MRPTRLIPALAAAAALTVPAATAAPALASAASTSCRVEFYDLDAVNVDEADGQDELRLLVDSYLYPNGWVPMRAGDDADPGDFDDVSTTVGTTGLVSFALREVTPPVVSSGTGLGYIYAYGATCATLTPGQTYVFTKRITGTDETYYAYDIKLRMVGL
ncbi:hypothetical protein MF672_033165 [Actinomadura sp. ATCC 31491]|uniref:Proteinase inhibitor I42 chagasin domain-containing protein n=1 Tax=Actinomadura luzonensis TaxID=2805427 RepID=A0ABT0G3B3_9ACTN|nr:hypothetical protein [Actinomadura luzonensis]MCK2218611.1 hypothetical protein [Actinomadura luzonensis]